MTLFITDLQSERASVCFALFVSIVRREKLNLTGDFQETDKSLLKVNWRPYGPAKLFSTKLRFQIRLDDFRYCNLT